MHELVRPAAPAPPSLTYPGQCVLLHGGSEIGEVPQQVLGLGFPQDEQLTVRHRLDSELAPRALQ